MRNTTTTDIPHPSTIYFIFLLRLHTYSQKYLTEKIRLKIKQFSMHGIHGVGAPTPSSPRAEQHDMKIAVLMDEAVAAAKRPYSRPFLPPMILTDITKYLSYQNLFFRILEVGKFLTVPSGSKSRPTPSPACTECRRVLHCLTLWRKHFLGAQEGGEC